MPQDSFELFCHSLVPICVFRLGRLIEANSFVALLSSSLRPPARPPARGTPTNLCTMDQDPANLDFSSSQHAYLHVAVPAEDG